MDSEPREPLPMLDGVPQLGDIFDGYGLVHYTVVAILEAAGVPADQLTREHAALALPLSPFYDTLTERERAAVLRRFGAR